MTCNRLTKKNQEDRIITPKIKFHDFRQVTQSQSITSTFAEKKQIIQTTQKLLRNIDFKDKKVRLLGISISNFENKAVNKPDQKDNK